MPQTLTVGTPPNPGAVKRQRSEETRDVHTKVTPVGLKVTNGGPLKLSARVPLYLDKTKSEIASTFQDLEWKQRFRLFHALENPQTSPFRVDRSDVVVSRNRYGNVQPWDQSRIKLATPIAGSDYVNASPIILKSRMSPTRSGIRDNGDTTAYDETKYIATQGPKEGQFVQFWHMVMQETAGDVGVIVMLTQCYEASKEKCAQYFPVDTENPSINLTLSEDRGKAAQKQPPQNRVTLISSTYDPSVGCEVRLFELKINGSTKTIHHFLFDRWPDFGKPEAEDRVALLELTRRSKQIARDNVRFIHCSAGVGRTGTFIALDFLVREIEEGRFLDITAYPSIKSPTYHNQHSNDNNNTNTSTWGKSGPAKLQTPTTEEFEESSALKEDLVYSTVNSLREQRMMMVMNDLQYAFLYEVVREAFWAKYRAKPEGAVVKGAGKEKEKESQTAVLEGKVAKTEDGSGDDEVEGAGSASEAETEIIGKGDEDEDDTEDDTEDNGSIGDPYAVVAPPSIREGIKKEP